MKTIPVLYFRAATILLSLFLILSSRELNAQSPSFFDLIEATIPEMQAAMDSGVIDSEYLVRQYLARIDAFDVNGPMLNSVLSLNPQAINTARALDAERAAAGPRGPLHGIPVLLKDNIDTFDMPTTAGSIILRDSVPPDDAFLAQQLRDAGAIILGKADLSEFANWVSFDMPLGFSALGGQTLNAYGPDRYPEFNPSGSSNGSAVSVSANLAAAAVGTETQGSIISPSTTNSVVGIRPTLGLISRDGVIPIAPTQDTAGPIARTVTDAAIMLGAMVGVDPADPATSVAEGMLFDDYTQFLDANGLEGKRLGVVRHPFLQAPDFFFEESLPVVESALVRMEQLGATIVDDLDMSDNLFPLVELWGDFLPEVLTHEFGPAIEEYLASLGDEAPAETLADIVAFNNENPDERIPFGQGILETSLATGGDLTAPEYQEQLEAGPRLIGTEGFDALMETNDLDALVFSDGWSALGAITGYPTISVPAGYNSEGLPVGIEFLAGRFSEPELLALAYAFEQGTMLRLPPSSAPAIAGDRIPEPSAELLAAIGAVGLGVFGRRRRAAERRETPA